MFRSILRLRLSSRNREILIARSARSFAKRAGRGRFENPIGALKCHGIFIRTWLRIAQAGDPDLGINGEIRYQILGREDAPRFAIDPLSGQVRSVTSFGRDAGRVFGFDVKATDRRGAESGRSSIANVFVSPQAYLPSALSLSARDAS